MVSKMYPKGLEELAAGNVNWATDTDIQVLLLNASGVYDETHNFVSQIVANEITGTTRQVLTGKAVTRDAANDRVIHSAADANFPSVPAAQTVNAAVVFKQVTNDADSYLLAYLDGTNVSTDGTDIPLKFNATTGVFTANY